MKEDVMNYLQICLSILAAYAMIAAIMFIVDMLMEYVIQKQNQIIREHAKPTIMSMFRTIPFHLQDAFFWPAELKKLFK
jgi:methionine salvage enolase-phosphatase E1